MNTADTKDEKPTLLTLPRELRDIIWEYACENVVVCVQATPTKTPLDQNNASATFIATDSNIGILQTCSQIREEATPIYFSSTTFCFAQADLCARWLKRYVAPRGLMSKLKHLRIHEPSRDCNLSWLDRVRDIFAESDMKDIASMIQDYSIETLSKFQRRLGSQEQAKLTAGAVQVLVVSREMEVAWTAHPEAFEI